MGPAINPYDSDRHSLSDPRDDDHTDPRERPARPYGYNPYEGLPLGGPSPCMLSGFCGKKNRHLGDCDMADRLELIPIHVDAEGRAHYADEPIPEPDEEIPFP